MASMVCSDDNQTEGNKHTVHRNLTYFKNIKTLELGRVVHSVAKHLGGWAGGCPRSSGPEWVMQWIPDQIRQQSKSLFKKLKSIISPYLLPLRSISFCLCCIKSICWLTFLRHMQTSMATINWLLELFRVDMFLTSLERSRSIQWEFENEIDP